MTWTKCSTHKQCWHLMDKRGHWVSYVRAAVYFCKRKSGVHYGLKWYIHGHRTPYSSLREARSVAEFLADISPKPTQPSPKVLDRLDVIEYAWEGSGIATEDYAPFRTRPGMREKAAYGVK